MMTSARDIPRCIPVDLLTGFLGSGKTTLLQHLLEDPGFGHTAVLINEFGEVALDHLLLDRIDENVVLLNSGCICCTVRGELAEALLHLNTRQANGEIPPFDRIVIETTGLADPYPALSTLRAHPVLVNHFELDKVLTTVDAVNAGGQLQSRLEAIRQVSAADLIVITKTDLVALNSVAALTAQLLDINPSARVIDADEVASALRETGTLRAAPLGTRASFIVSEQEVAEADEHTRHTHHHHHAVAGSTVTSLSLVMEDRLDWTAFGIWLTMLLNRHGDKIFRVKGILNIDGEDRPVAIHGVQRLVHPPVHMNAWSDANRQSRLVFIMSDLDPEIVRRSLAAFNDLAGSLATPSRTEGRRAFETSPQLSE